MPKYLNTSMGQRSVTAGQKSFAAEPGQTISLSADEDAAARLNPAGAAILDQMQRIYEPAVEAVGVPKKAEPAKKPEAPKPEAPDMFGRDRKRKG